MHLQADIADPVATERAVIALKSRFGSIDAVIHSAGIANKRLVTAKSLEQFLEVLRPKVEGALVLDHVTRNERLELFALFSSTAGLLGDMGQCDYALANQFLDRFAELRDAM